MVIKDCKEHFENTSSKQFEDITLLTKVHIVNAMVFPLVTYGCKSWTVKKVEHWRIDAFELWCWRRLLRVAWTAGRSNQSILFFSFFLSFFFICSEFCHTLKWNSHGFTCVPHPDPPSHLPLHPLPLGLPSVPGPSACLMHPTWAGDLFHPR